MRQARVEVLLDGPGEEADGGGGDPQVGRGCLAGAHVQRPPHHPGDPHAGGLLPHGLRPEGAPRADNQRQALVDVLPWLRTGLRAQPQLRQRRQLQARRGLVPERLRKARRPGLHAVGPAPDHLLPRLQHLGRGEARRQLRQDHPHQPDGHVHHGVRQADGDGQGRQEIRHLLQALRDKPRLPRPRLPAQVRHRPVPLSRQGAREVPS
mmetsp:Transcript_133720/g.372777  ORF Transcript_133720/g.372777 Transcript_133720/m.372777 type:complete len:208 (+) Transcript_133720:345-968(+)